MANSSSVYDWFQERLEIQDITDDVTSKYVPPHVNIFYCLGGITLVCFLIQFATGFAMTFYYKPTVTPVSYTHLPSPRDLSTSRMPSSA